MNPNIILHKKLIISFITLKSHFVWERKHKNNKP